MTTWTLMDYGVGNLHSLRKALETTGATTAITEDAAALADADIAVLPGVGAFGHVMDRLAPAADALRARHAAGRPILGVCIGQQVLYAGSEEAPDVAGLDILPGRAVRLPASAGKVPHMGWNHVLACAEDPLAKPVAGAHVYYVHSYAAPTHDGTIATTSYGRPFTAMVHAGNTVATQFHPEKSSHVGRRFLHALRETLEAEATA